MNGSARYDRIGSGYERVRRPDPRIAAAVVDALGDASTVVNVGAGTGSYEPPNRRVLALEPSWVMISQRGPAAASAVQGVAERLPFPDGAFDAAMAIFTMHHWSDQPRGLSELGRVATRIVIATIDTAVGAWFWLTDYFPEIGEWDRGHFMTLDELRSRLSSPSVLTIPIPHDCHDGFLAAYWRRPRAYLDPDVRAGISTFALIHDDARERGLRRLEHDLNTGAWDRRYGHLRGIQELDAGYRLVVASS